MMISLIETILKYAPERPIIRPEFKKYLEVIKSQREQILGKQEAVKNVNPLNQFRKLSNKESNNA